MYQLLGSFSLRQFYAVITFGVVFFGLSFAIYQLGQRWHEQQSQLDQLMAEVRTLTEELDRVRSYALRIAPTLRGTDGRKARFTDRDGWPELRMTVHADKFGRDWPFRAREVIVHGTLFGLCLVEIDGELWGLNGLAGNSGYPMADVRILKTDPTTSGLDFMDVSAVLDVALRLVEKIKLEHIANPYQVPH